VCGIAGFVNRDRSRPADADVLRAMTHAIHHRGPDEDGFLLDGEAGLGMRRLSILDVAGGTQPIYNEDRSVGVVYNGEIYNFQELREDLIARGHTFRTRSDTEVIVHQYEEDGPDCLNRFNGMFGLAIWDLRRRRLMLGRDRLGIKPLHYMEGAGSLVFGSELKSLLQHPDATRELDPISVSRYLTHECVPAPRSIFRGIRKLPPGHRLIWEDGRASVEEWWRIRFDGTAAPKRPREALEELERLLSAAVERRLVSDVPLGGFLSGGIDSSTIVAFMQRHASVPVKTFSIGFQEESFDESNHARTVAKHLGTEHHERVFSPEDMIDLVPRLAEFLDEPLGDGSVLPTFLLSAFTREQVTVSLSGDGGDELFAGYPTYFAHRAASLYERVPRLLRRGLVAPLVRRLPVSTRNFSFDFAAKRFISGDGMSPLERHLVWMGSFSGDSKRAVLSGDMNRLLADDDEFADARALWEGCDAPDDLTRVLHQDMRVYMQDDILTKVDRTSMAHSLEVRVPLLDHTVVEFVTSLPISWKLKGWTTKYLLKQLALRYLPEQIVTRKKKGFGVPIAAWIRGPLRELVQDLLSPDRIRSGGVFEPATVTRLLEEHLSGRFDHRKTLFTLLVFELWRERWMAPPTKATFTAAVRPA
jgi:asparagine synthase (glutamine-hydrolysing)